MAVAKLSHAKASIVYVPAATGVQPALSSTAVLAGMLMLAVVMWTTAPCESFTWIMSSVCWAESCVLVIVEATLTRIPTLGAVTALPAKSLSTGAVLVSL